MKTSHFSPLEEFLQKNKNHTNDSLFFFSTVHTVFITLKPNSPKKLLTLAKISTVYSSRSDAKECFVICSCKYISGGRNHEFLWNQRGGLIEKLQFIHKEAEEEIKVH